MLIDEILCKTLIENYNTDPDDIEKIVNIKCYIALQEIKAILEKDHLDDAQCFARIEDIIRVYEELGSDGGNRHDFG